MLPEILENLCFLLILILLLLQSGLRARKSGCIDDAMPIFAEFIGKAVNCEPTTMNGHDKIKCGACIRHDPAADLKSKN